MSEIISARCFGCGHTLKVPAALGGKKARCPQCTNTITIPALHETQDDIIGDDQLTEVAKDGDSILDDDPPAPGEEVVDGELVDEDPSSVRRRGGTAARRGSSSSANLRAQPAGGRSGTQPRYAPPPPKKSGAGVAVGVALGVLAVGGIIIGAAMGGGGGDAARGGRGGKAPAGGTETGGTVKPPSAAIDDALQGRVLDYLEAVNKGDPAKVIRYFPPEEEGTAIRDVNRFLEQRPAYSAYEVVKADAATGAVTFKHSGGEKSMTWKLVSGTWYLGEKPTP
jgi:phage FluMu protein Com